MKAKCSHGYLPGVIMTKGYGYNNATSQDPFQTQDTAKWGL